MELVCSDPLIVELRRRGYNPIRLPRAGIEPLQLLGRDGKDLSRLGAIDSVLKAAKAPLPKIQADLETSKIEVRRSGRLKVGLGISVLQTFLQALGAKGAGIGSEFQQVKNLVFVFDEVREDRIEVSELDKYLADADVDPGSRYLGDLLESDGVYVITSILKSRKFAVEAHAGSGSGVDLKADAIQQAVGGNVSVATASDNQNRITFDGGTYLAFGYQAVRLMYDQGRYTAIKPVSHMYLRAVAAPEVMEGCELYAAPGVFSAIGETRAATTAKP